VDSQAYPENLYGFWKHHCDVVIHSFESEGWTLEIDVKRFSHYQYALLVMNPLEHSQYVDVYGDAEMIWQLVAWEDGKMEILANKFPTTADCFMLNEKQADVLESIDYQYLDVEVKRMIKEYVETVTSCAKGWCLSCKLSSLPTPSSSSEKASYAFVLDLNVASAASSLSVNRLMEQFLKHRLSGDQSNTYHFSPAPLYYPVRRQSFEWQEMAERPYGLAEMTKSFNHQLRALNWMISRETGLQGAHTHVDDCQLELESFWIPLTSEYYYSPWLKRISKNIVENSHLSFSEPRGGILADEVGMGKTIEVISLILSRPYVPINQNSDSTLQKPPKVYPAGAKSGELRCYCQGDDKKKPVLAQSALVECPFCKLLQHVRCVSYDVKHPDPLYACPECGSQGHLPYHGPKGGSETPVRKIIDSGTTLIVCPDSILPQWQSELQRHVAAGKLNVTIFTGETADKHPGTEVVCRPEQFRHYDVVLTTYQVLSDSLDRMLANEGQKAHSRRRGRKARFPVMPSPLAGFQWYRVCFDESQMLGEGQSKAATLALNLKVRFRWAVSGTPISKSIGDLYGLMLFLNMAPYTDRHFWMAAIEKPLMGGHHERITEILISVLKRVMWRTEKADAAEELHMPGLSDHTHVVQFTEVEKYMYQRRWQYCEEKLLQAKERQTKGKLTPEHISKMIGNLVTLRLACCHPQLGQQTGLKDLSEGVMSAPAVFKQLIHQARIQAEDRQRTRVFYLHGLAALAMAQRDFHTAARLYRQVLDPGEFNLHTDYSTLLHARHNLIEASQQILESKDENDALAPPERDVLLSEMAEWQEKIDEYQSRYIADAKHRLAATATNYMQNLQEMTSEFIAHEEALRAAAEKAKLEAKLAAERARLEKLEKLKKPATDPSDLQDEASYSSTPASPSSGSSYSAEDDPFEKETAQRAGNASQMDSDLIGSETAPLVSETSNMDITEERKEIPDGEKSNQMDVDPPAQVTNGTVDSTQIEANAGLAATNGEALSAQEENGSKPETEPLTSAVGDLDMKVDANDVAIHSDGALDGVARAEEGTATKTEIESLPSVVGAQSMEIDSNTIATAPNADQTSVGGIEGEKVNATENPALAPANGILEANGGAPEVTKEVVEEQEVEIVMPEPILHVEEGDIGFYGFPSNMLPASRRIEMSEWIEDHRAWWRVGLQLLSEHDVGALLERLRADFGKIAPTAAFASRRSLAKFLSTSLDSLREVMTSIQGALFVLCEHKTIGEFATEIPAPNVLARVQREVCPKCVSRKLAQDKKKQKYDAKKSKTVNGKEAHELCIWCALQNQISRLNVMLQHYRDNLFLAVLNALHQFIADPDVYQDLHFKNEYRVVKILQQSNFDPRVARLRARRAAALALQKIPEPIIESLPAEMVQPTENGSQEEHASEATKEMVSSLAVVQQSDEDPPFEGAHLSVRYYLTKDVAKEIGTAAKANFRAIEVLKRRVKLLDRLCDAHLEFSSHGEELKMMTTRMRLHSDEKGEEIRYAQTLFHEDEIPALRAEYEAGLAGAQFELQEQVSQLRYLSKQAEENLSENCSICWDPLPEMVVLLPCGHMGCPECFKKAIEAAPKCPVCRAKVNLRNHEDLQIVARHGAEVPDLPTRRAPRGQATQWGSKIEAIVALVVAEKRKYPDEKFLLFSHWVPVLDLVTSALKEAQISVINTQGDRFAAALDKFRSDPNITVLCLPLHRGSKGANLMCASHIIFAEPSLLAASEAQAIGRIHRLGQTKKMKIHRFYVAGTVEQSIYDLSMLRKNEKRTTAAIGFGVQEKESNFLDLDILEKILRGAPLASSSGPNNDQTKSQARIDIMDQDDV
jgi:SNF2 family DNA or RNA helicase